MSRLRDSTPMAEKDCHSERSSMFRPHFTLRPSGILGWMLRVVLRFSSSFGPSTSGFSLRWTTR